MPSPIGGHEEEATCAKPANASCGSKSISVYADGLHGSDDGIFVCRNDTVDWQVVHTRGKVKRVVIHFDETPFDPKFGSGDYCAGDDCQGHQSGTDKLAAHTRDTRPEYVRCHKYTLTVVLPDGTPKIIDPHIIVAGSGSSH
jgi:hypothetical protein